MSKSRGHHRHEEHEEHEEHVNHEAWVIPYADMLTLLMAPVSYTHLTLPTSDLV